MVLAGGDPRGIEPATGCGALPGIAELGVGAVRLRPTGRGVCAGQGGLLRQLCPHYLASLKQTSSPSSSLSDGARVAAKDDGEHGLVSTLNVSEAALG